MQKHAGRVALWGITAALSLLFLLLTAVPVTEIALAAAAGMVAIPAIIETGRRGGLLIFGGVSLLALLLVPSMEAKALYIAFFGWYPMIKSLLEGRQLHRAVETLLKLAAFNLPVILAYWLMVRFWGLPAESFSIAGHSLPWVFLIAGNGIFLLYDLGLSRIITAYLLRWQPHVRRLLGMG